jgi:hypothetical protein
MSVDQDHVTALVAPLINLNPFDWLGDKAKEGLADGWTSVMISIWSAGLWLLKAVFKILDRFLTPDLTDPGLIGLHSISLWISLMVASVIGFAQIGQAAIRRDGTSLATLLVGLVQYGAVSTCWVAVFGTLVLASAGLTTGLMHSVLDINGFAGYPADAGWPDKVGGTVAATVLGLTSLLLLIPAAFGYVLIMLVREGALLILTATAPIAAAGALGTGTRAWLWKSLRWFLAACLTAPLLALVLGLGVQITRAAFPDTPPAPTASSSHVEAPTTQPLPIVLADADTEQAADGDTTSPEASQVGMAVVGAAIMIVGCFCPMALFRLLAFVDPGTASGASLRTTLHANGGMRGLVGRHSGAATADPAGSGAASQTAPDGRAASEQAADAETGNRFQAAASRVIPIAGRGIAGTMRVIGDVATQAVSVGVDVAGQAGIGSSGYYDAGGNHSTAARRHVASAPSQPGNPGSAPTAGSATSASGEDRGVADQPPRPGPPGSAGGGAAGLADDAVFLA